MSIPLVQPALSDDSIPCSPKVVGSAAKKRRLRSSSSSSEQEEENTTQKKRKVSDETEIKSPNVAKAVAEEPKSHPTQFVIRRTAIRRGRPRKSDRQNRKTVEEDQRLRGRKNKTEVEEMKVKCPICGIELKNKSVLKFSHLPRHFDEKLFECDVCQKRFNGSSDLRVSN